jgi:aminoglycoside N3'-acetyltransferase
MDAIRKRIFEGLEKLGVSRGDHLAVGASFRSLGPVDGGPDVFIDALIDFVGDEGTVMMNTHTPIFYLAEVRAGITDSIFDAASTPCITGATAERFRQRASVLRSRHPAYSVAAGGRHAHLLTAEHDENAAAFLPYDRLAEIGGKYLAVGIGYRLAGFRHCAQQAAGLLDVVPWRRAVRYRDRAGRIQTFILRDRGGCTRRLPELVETLRSEGLVSEGRIGPALSILVPARESLARMSSVLKERPEANLCDRIGCYWCRELERRLRLCRKIENPKIFQKYGVLRSVIAMVNRVRELDNRAIAKAKILVRDRNKKRQREGAKT